MNRIALLGLLAVVGCGGSAAGQFAGTWKCTETLTNSVVGSQTINTILDAEAVGDNEIAFIDHDTGQCPPRKLHVSGNSASLEPGQTCDGSNGTQLEYVSWTATFNGNTLTMDEHEKAHLSQTLVLASERTDSCQR